MKRKRSEAGWVTLIELLVVMVIILIVVYMLYGRPTSTGGVEGVTGVGGSGQAQTVPGKALEQARAVECQQNLRGLRQEIAAYRIDAEQPPASLDEIRGGAKACPVSGNPYVYDPQTGTVRCTTPGHENF